MLVVPEFVELLQGDKELAGQFLNAMEDAEIRVGLVKAGKVGAKEIEKITHAGAKFQDGRLSYRNYCTIWSATHTLDGLTDRSREALLSRFYIVHLSPGEIPNYAAWNDPAILTDKNLEEDIGKWLSEIYTRATIPDKDFAHNVARNGPGYRSER